MKKVLFIALLAFGMSAKAQPFVLEHDYDSASTFNIALGGVNAMSQLMMINFEVSGEHYVKINRWGKYISIYDMTHALVKTISLANCPIQPAYNTLGDIIYLSEHLFNDDSKIEFMYVKDATAPTSCLTNIYNEDGVLLFSEQGSPLIRANWPNQQYPIYNTTAGTKLILSYQNAHAIVFSLPGILTTAIQEGNTPLLNGYASNLKLSAPYPNPAENTTQIDYTLPKGVTQGEIVFYTIAGAEIKRFKVDNTFKNILISTADIEAGTYYYQLQTAAESSGGKKMVVIK